MRLTIKSRILHRDLEFSRPGDYYIYVDLNGEAGSLGKQICDGGAIVGSSLGTQSDDLREFAKVCRAWYRAYAQYHLRHIREYRAHIRECAIHQINGVEQ